MKQFYLKSLVSALLCMMSVSASAYDVQIDGIYYNLDWENKTAEVTYKEYDYLSAYNYYSDYSGDVVIPSEITIGPLLPNDSRKTISTYDDGINTFRVTSIGDCAFCNDSNLISVTIPSSVISIGYLAFYDDLNLISVTIPSSVTSIGSQAFFGCKGMKKVIVPDIAAWCGILFYDVTSNPLCYAQHLYSDENTEITNLVIPDGMTTIGYYTFAGCVGLTSVTIPSSVTYINDRAFEGCSFTDIKVHVTDLSAFCNNCVIPAFMGTPIKLIDENGNEIKVLLFQTA